MRLRDESRPVAAGLALIAVTTVLGACSGSSERRAGGSGDAVARLNSLPCPTRFPGRLASYTRRQVEVAKRGNFAVAGIATRIRPPIDWSQDPIGSPVYRRALSDLAWIDPLLAAYRSHGDVGAIQKAKAILLDFARSHPHPVGHDGDVWERKRTGDRLVRIVYVLRAAACSGVLGNTQARRLLTAARRHARFLVQTPDTPQRTNHDLTQDLSLMAVGRYLPFLASADHWYANGARRFRSGIGKLVDLRTGVYLEQTASYQALAIDRVANYLQAARHPAARYRRLLRKMRGVTSWLTMPDGTLAPLGDTPFVTRAPAYARAHSVSGFSPTRVSGFEIVEQRGSYLATTAGYHRNSHKQADELSFDLYEHGHRVIVDSGRDDQGRGPSGAKAYTLSSQAHSTLTVDARSFPLNGDFYGSALDAKGAGGGWYAIEGHNPLLRAQGVRHRRLFLYKPGVALVIVDRLESAKPHTYRRYVQLAPGLAASLRKPGEVALRSPDGFAGTIWWNGAGRGVSARLYRGHLNPLRGWYAPAGISRLRPRYDLQLRSRSRSARLVTTIALGKRAVHASPSARGAIVDLPGTGRVDVEARPHGGRLSVTASPAG